jgi:hypothetical protein
MVELMLANEWKTGKTVNDLAALWGIKPQTARLLSAEASKIVRGELLANVSMGIVPTLVDIMQSGCGDVGAGDKMAAVQAAKVLADMAGLNEQPKTAEQSASNEPRTITVTYHASVKPIEPASD